MKNFKNYLDNTSIESAKSSNLRDRNESKANKTENIFEECKKIEKDSAWFSKVALVGYNALQAVSYLVISQFVSNPVTQYLQNYSNFLGMSPQVLSGLIIGVCCLSSFALVYGFIEEFLKDSKRDRIKKCYEDLISANLAKCGLSSKREIEARREFNLSLNLRKDNKDRDERLIRAFDEFLCEAAGEIDPIIMAYVTCYATSFGHLTYSKHVLELTGIQYTTDISDEYKREIDELVHNFSNIPYRATGKPEREMTSVQERISKFKKSELYKRSKLTAEVCKFANAGVVYLTYFKSLDNIKKGGKGKLFGLVRTFEPY